MNIVIIGSGNVATFYGIRFKAAGHHIVQVLSPNIHHAQTLAHRLQCDAIDEYASLNRDADLYVLGVRDDSLMELAQTLELPNKIIVYGAGAVPLSALNKISTRIVCLWCLFSIQKDHLPEQNHFPVVYNQSNINDKALAQQLAGLLSDSIYALNDEQKTQAHLGAVLVNNFTNHLYAIAYELMKESGIDFSLLHPIILNTAENAIAFDPKTRQTGPAIRNDEQTMHEHSLMLNQHPTYKQVYEILSESIRLMYKPKDTH